MTTADLLLHPVRVRIVQAFLGGRTLTTGALAAELSDVPSASLYRQVAKLVNGGILAIVRERRVRGTVERTYALRTHAAAIGRAELASLSAEDHRQLFLAFVAALIADFDRYLDSGDIDFVRDRVGYRMVGMWLTDEEFAEFGRDLNKVVRPRLANVPEPGRILRVLRTIVLPASEPRDGDRPDRAAEHTPDGSESASAS
jgi:hypothetical protein